MISQENFDMVSDHITQCLTAADYETHLFSTSAFGDDCTLDEVYTAFKDAGYDPEYYGDTVKVIL